ncbi:MAG: hypothetical protein JWQ10_3303 [Herbaspirillum sp.]|nr:hypothetical protein [Herbaspirillum sp.]
MKKLLLLLILGMAAMGVATTASADRGHFRGGVFIGGPVWGPGYYPSPYYYPPPQPVYVQPAPPPVYVEQTNDDYWYYCAQPKAYYPYVKECPQGWMKVVPGSGPR